MREFHDQFRFQNPFRIANPIGTFEALYYINYNFTRFTRNTA